MSIEILSPGKIFLAEERGFIENETHQRYSTFNFDEYRNQHKAPFADLYSLNDEILPAGGQLIQTTKNNGIMLLVPVVGGIVLEINGKTYEAEAGEVLSVPVSPNCTYTLTNVFESDWVNFLHFELNARIISTDVVKYQFDIENIVNELIAVVNDISTSYKLSIGRFAGREDFEYMVQRGSNVFGFIIAGAFEFQNRLMHERDGIALWDINKIEAEALSNGAVVLLLEMKDI